MIRATTSRPRFLLFARLVLVLLFASTLLEARPQTSLLRTDPPPGWEGFLMRTTVEAGFIPAGQNLHSTATPRASTTNTDTAWVNPAATYPLNADVGVPTVTATRNPASGAAKDTATGTVDFDYLLQQDARDQWGFDITTTTSAVNAMVDFGSGPEPADSFVEVTLWMRSDGPYLVPDAWMELPALPALNDPATEQMLATAVLGQAYSPCAIRNTLIGYQQPSDPAVVAPFKLCPETPFAGGTFAPGYFEYNLDYSIVTPFGTDPTYSYSGIASAAVVSPLVVTNTNDAGPGSLRQAIADAVDGDYITFDPSLSGQTIALTSGEVLVSGKELSIDASTLDTPVTIDPGGASRILRVDPTGEVSFYGLVLQNGSSPARGGAISNTGILSLFDCEILNSTSTSGFGGGIANDGGSLFLTHCVVAGNSSSLGNGGGIANFNGGSITLDDCEISGNEAANSGGGLHSDSHAAASLRNCSLHHNTATSGGGTHWSGAASTPVSLNNSTIAENEAEIGPAIYHGGGFPIQVRHCTITRNTGESDAAVWTPGVESGPDPEAVFFSSIISDNTPDDVDMTKGTLTSDGYNLVGSGNSLADFTSPGDQTGITDPELSPLAKYFSSTSVALPLSGSPAVDTGDTDPQTLPTDQRGLARIADGDRNGFSTIDVGAAETTTPTLIVTNTNDSGPGSLRQVVDDVPDHGLVLFAPILSFDTTDLTSGVISIPFKTVTINAESIRTIDRNFRIDGQGARIFRTGNSASLTIVALDLTGGFDPDHGGAISNGGELIASRCEFYSNAVGTGPNQSGGAIWSSADPVARVTLIDCEFRDNLASRGAAVETSMQGTITGCRFEANHGMGALATLSGALTIDRCAFAFNTSDNWAAGFSNQGTATITNSSFYGNKTTGLGAAVSNLGFLEMETCTVFGNTAALGGGGVYSSTSVMSLRHCTVTGNHAENGLGDGFLSGGSGSSRIFSSIISGNRNGLDVATRDAGVFVSDGHNLVGGGPSAGAFNAPTDLVGIHDPRLGPLGDNGSGIPTMLPRPGSPALDSGATDASSPATDQRGEPRLVDGDGNGSALADIGAAEAAVPTVITVANTNDSGPGSLRQAIADATTRGTVIDFAPALNGQTITLTSGELSLAARSLLLDAGSLTNGVTLSGGGASRILHVAEDSTAFLQKLILRDGTTNADGGGLFNEGGIRIADCTFTGSSATDSGGELASIGSYLRIEDSTFTGTGAVNTTVGGALAAARSTVLDISGTTFTNYLAPASGGAIILLFGDTFAGPTRAFAYLDQCLFEDNESLSTGGALDIGGENAWLTVSRSTFTGNRALCGGAMQSDATVVRVDRCTFEDNSATLYGGAFSHAFGSLRFEFCTITGNSAPAGWGGGIWLSDTAGPPSPQISLQSTILSGNTGSDVDANPPASAVLFTSLGNNLIGFGNAAAQFTQPGDQTGVNNPRLAPLANYGGPLPTMHPLPGSPVIDAGNLAGLSLPPATDQRGFARVHDGDNLGGATVDIGAVEFAPLVLQTIPVTNLADFGPGSLRQAVEDAGIGSLITIDPSLDGGVIPLSGPLSLQVPFVKIDASALPEGITFNGQNSTHLLELATTAVVDLCAVTLEDGFSFACGGGIINEGVLTLNECTVRNCIAQLQGGGICNQGGRLVLRNSSLVGNEAADPDQGRGGAIFNDAELTFNTVTLEQCTLADNTAGQFGGGIFNFLGRLDLRHSTVAYNTAPTDGAGVATFGDLSAETHVFSSIIGGNFGTDVAFVLDPSNQFFSGGYNLIGLGNAAGAFVKPGDFNSVANPSLAPLGNYGGRTLTILPRSNSLALEGGDLASLTLESDQRGLPRLIDLGHDGIVLPDIGAVEVGPFPFPTATALVTTGTDFAPGSLRTILAPDIIPGTLVTFAPGLDGDTIGFTGGEIVVSGLFLKIDALALPNGLELNGGGTSRIFNVASQSDLELCGLSLREGASIGGPGGAIFNEGFLTVRQCSFENNDAGQGGAIANQFGQLTLLDSTFSNNLATDGGAIHHDGDLIDRIAIIDQCTFAENTAGNHGGALFNLMGIMTVRHSTISANEAFGPGSGIATNGDSSVETRLFSTIAAGNFGSADLAIVLDPLDRYATDGGNVIGTTSGTSVFPGIEDQVGILDPGLSSLGAHGGRTRTMIVEFGSPAREAGGTDSNSRLTDQRGFVRTFGNGPDSGAYEASGHGGYFVWASEFIPPGNDRSFAGHGDDDRRGNGTEYGLDTDPGRADAASPNNPLLTGTSSQPSFTFGIRPEAFDVIWIVQRSTDLQSWTELYRYDGTSETIATDVSAILDLAGRRITVTDDAPPVPRAFYRLAVLYNP